MIEREHKFSPGSTAARKSDVILRSGDSIEKDGAGGGNERIIIVGRDRGEGSQIRAGINGQDCVEIAAPRGDGDRAG